MIEDPGEVMTSTLVPDESGESLGYPERMQRADLLKAALELPSEEREQLVQELLASLDGSPERDVEEAWANEIERRLDEAEAGTVTPIPWSEGRAEALAAIRRARGR